MIDVQSNPTFKTYLFERIIGLANENINFATRGGMKNIKRTALRCGLTRTNMI